MQSNERQREIRRLRMRDAPLLQPRYVHPSGVELEPSFAVSALSPAVSSRSFATGCVLPACVD